MNVVLVVSVVFHEKNNERVVFEDNWDNRDNFSIRLIRTNLLFKRYK